jgi:MFS family permease
MHPEPVPQQLHNGHPSPESKFRRFANWIRGSRWSMLMIVSLAVFTDAFTYGSIVPYAPLYERSYGLSEIEVGMLMASFAFGSTPLHPVVGVVGDRIGHKYPFTAGIILLAAVTLLFAFSTNLIMLTIARVLQGLLGVCASRMARNLIFAHQTHVHRLCGSIHLVFRDVFGC